MLTILNILFTYFSNYFKKVGKICTAKPSTKIIKTFKSYYYGK